MDIKLRAGLKDRSPRRIDGDTALPIALFLALAALWIVCRLTPSSLQLRWIGADTTGFSVTTIDGALDSRTYPLESGATLRFTPSYRLFDRTDSVGLDVLAAPLSLRFVSQGDGNFVIYDSSRTPWSVVAAQPMPHGNDVTFSVSLTRLGTSLNVAYENGTDRAQGTVPWPREAQAVQLRLNATSPADELRGFR